MIAIGPVTPKKNVILAKYLPNTIQLVPVERHVFWNAIADASGYLRELDEDAHILAQRPQIGPILLAGTTFRGNWGSRKVVNYNSQFRSLLRNFQNRSYQFRIRVRTIQLKPSGCQFSKVRDKTRPGPVARKIAIPQVAVANSNK